MLLVDIFFFLMTFDRVALVSRLGLGWVCMRWSRRLTAMVVRKGFGGLGAQLVRYLMKFLVGGAFYRFLGAYILFIIIIFC